MDKKIIAKYTLEFIGGTPKVERFYNVDESKAIDILSSDFGELKGVSTCATIGVSNVNIGLSAKGKTLRVELIAAGAVEDEILGNILSSIAFDIFNSKTCVYGMIIPNIISTYIRDIDMKHIVLMSPVFWSKYCSYEDENTIVTWLMVVPISDSEKSYIEDKGIDFFDKLLGEQDTDVLDYYRDSML